MISPVKPLEMADEWLQFMVSCSQMNVAAAEVITRRTLRMLQGKMTPAEAFEIVMEKAPVMVISFKEAAVATAQGADPVQIARAALVPIKGKTLSNWHKLRNQ